MASPKTWSDLLHSCCLSDAHWNGQPQLSSCYRTPRFQLKHIILLKWYQRKRDKPAKNLSLFPSSFSDVRSGKKKSSSSEKLGVLILSSPDASIYYALGTRKAVVFHHRYHRLSWAFSAGFLKSKYRYSTHDSFWIGNFFNKRQNRFACESMIATIPRARTIRITFTTTAGVHVWYVMVCISVSFNLITSKAAREVADVEYQYQQLI